MLERTTVPRIPADPTSDAFIIKLKETEVKGDTFQPNNFPQSKFVVMS